jgi:hypothetical protein
MFDASYGTFVGTRHVVSGFHMVVSPIQVEQVSNLTLARDLQMRTFVLKSIDDVTTFL